MGFTVPTSVLFFQLHWRLSNASTSPPILHMLGEFSAANGWVALAFASEPGEMEEADAVIASSSAVQPYRLSEMTLAVRQGVRDVQLAR